MTFHRRFLSVSLMLVTCASLHADILRISAGSATRQIASEVEANYTTSHLFVDEIAGDSIPITVFFDPQTMGVESVDVFTNLNRRDRADDDVNADGIHDGIKPVDGNTIPSGDDSHYYKGHPMGVGGDGFYLTLYAEKTGAYRLTARYRLNGDAPGTWRWYQGRDHAVVVSPEISRDIRLYEINTLNIEASGTLFSQRSTFEDLSDRPGALHTSAGRSNQWNLQYAKNLGVNWLWFQPYHPYGWEGRHLSAENINLRANITDPNNKATTWLWNGGTPTTNEGYPYALGSPYAVKNFWEIEPRMSATFSGDPNNINDVTSQTNRDNAMTAFRNFVSDADAEGIHIMPDAAFNHTAWDVELGEPGIATDGGNPNASWMAAQGASGWAKTDLIHDRELRVFSRAGDYRKRASFYNSFFSNNIAPAPDRNDFGKWLDVCDVYFGRYAALVGAQDGSETNNYNNEGDWLDITEYEYGSNPSDPTGGGSFDAFTRATWSYFARYAPYWLEKTRPAGQNRNSLPSDGDAATRYAWDARGIDGLRCDFGQGLPPQAWEYIINVARSHKWSFVFMAETLDGGAPPYRSNRHFDILNENILFAAKGAGSKYDFTDYNGIFETRRRSFGQGLVLLNTVSHDEDNYNNPWAALARFAIFSTIDGAPMIFPGQELGISTFYGYDLMEKNFGKFIPHFKTYNSMMPLWNDTNFGNDQLYKVYAAINQARANSPALRSSNRWFIDGNGNNNQLYGVAKYESAGVSPAFQDVIIAFANLGISNDQPDTYVIPGTLANLLGIKDGRTYNVKNIAAYENPEIGAVGRREVWQWGSGITGANLKSSGFYVNLHKVPSTNADWGNTPYEAQYLKLHDVTPPPVPSTPGTPDLHAYVVGNSATFSWTPAADPDGGISGYRFQLGSTAGASDLFDGLVSGTSHTVTGLTYGSPVFARVSQVNIAGIQGPFSSSSNVLVLDPSGDHDGDGQANAAEQVAGTNPLDPSSVLGVLSLNPAGPDVQIHISSVPGKTYQLESNTDLGPLWQPIGSPVTATQAQTVLTHPAGAGDDRRFYRARVTP